MQITNPNNLTDTIIVTSQDTKSVSCELSNNGTLFDILSNSLYSDKILAVIREILCNAWDSHIFTNNTNTPLEVTLTETEFSVKDFGSGIDPEKILQIYGTYGQSTKTDDENQVGGFGIGSKAPFAYTDTFTVTNVYKNTKSVYIINKEPNQAPTIKTIYSGITDEPTGLTVSVLISKKNDYYSFVEKLNAFGSKTDIKIKLNELLQNNNDFSNSYCFVKSTHNRFNLNVKYNSVTYKVDPTIFHSNNILNDILDDSNDWFVFNDIVLNALPNTLDISATREALSYTKKTQDTLKILCDNFVGHITKLIKDNIKDSYKDIHTSKDYFNYIDEMDNFVSNRKCISKDEDFVKYLVFFLTKYSSKLRNSHEIHKEILNTINFYRKIMFSKIFNIKLIKLKRYNLVNSLVYVLFPEIIYTSAWKKISNHNYDIIPSKVYIVTNRATPIDRRDNSIKRPVLLTSLKEKDNLINKLTEFGFECVFVPSLRKEKTVIKVKEDIVHGRLYGNTYFHDLQLEPNSYIIFRNINSTIFNAGFLNHIRKWSSETSIKVYEIYYKKDFDLLKEQGHIDLEQEAESGEFIKKHFDIKFLEKSHIHLPFSTSYSKYDFEDFIKNNDNNFELIKDKKWRTFFINYKKNIIGINFYRDYMYYLSRHKNITINKDKSSTFNELIAKTGLKNIIDYKKINQYILDGKKKQVLDILTLT